MSVEHLDIDIPATVLDDLRDRLRGTRWPDEVTPGSWEQGTDLTWLRGVVERWADGYDWPTVQARLNERDHRMVRVDDRPAVHVVLERAEVEGALPLVLLHGWPSSFVQMLPIAPLLARPSEHGADPADAFDVVVLSLPGYGFSERPAEPGWDVTRIADLVVEVMAELGHERFAARGSDLGAGVLQQLALARPDLLVGLHLSGTNPYLGWVPEDLSDAEREFVAAAQDWNQREMAYAMEHSSKPQTLAYGLNDSPAGLAAWVLEKFRTWSDCGGDLASVYDLDDLLTNLTVYWVTGTIGSSMRLYWETVRSTSAAYGRVEVPTGMAMSGADMFPTPREWVERSYAVAAWTDLPRGGHFLEWEVPELVAADVRTFFRDRRG
ncbi:epoxide hydrolase family protein [Nocardioides sp. GXQ0305]|uniref:epoxide hydrolase family protein n=1 Tax=Nocardioides sp. GXQ0305 TaxID=3423912 RepID=UPI003D7C7071